MPIVGNLDEALTTLHEAQRVVEQAEGRLWEDEIRWLKGELILLQGGAATVAEREFQSSIGITISR